MIACILAFQQNLMPRPGQSDEETEPGPLLKVLSNFAPDVEWSVAHPAVVSYLNLGSLSEPFVTVQAIGQAVRQEALLTPAAGLAQGKFPAYVAAASAGPNEALIIAPGYEARFLAPLPIDLLSLDEDMLKRLYLLGIRTLGQLASLPMGAVLNQFGARGRFLYQLARGHDNRPVMGYRPEVVEIATRHFEGPVADRTILEAVFRGVAAELADRLRASCLASREVRLTLHLEDKTARQERLILRLPTGNPERLAHVLAELLTQAHICSGVIELEVGLADLVPAVGQQLDLFAHGLEQGSRLHEMLKDLVNRYGAGCFYRIALSDPESHLPERRFRLERLDRL